VPVFGSHYTLGIHAGPGRVMREIGFLGDTSPAVTSVIRVEKARLRASHTCVYGRRVDIVFWDIVRSHVQTRFALACGVGKNDTSYTS
jgi:hypothetical protein